MADRQEKGYKHSNSRKAWGAEPSRTTTVSVDVLMPSLDGGVLNQCVHLSTSLLELLEVLTGLRAGSKSDNS